jgi:hypothetical protein
MAVSYKGQSFVRRKYNDRCRSIVIIAALPRDLAQVTIKVVPVTLVDHKKITSVKADHCKPTRLR